MSEEKTRVDFNAPAGLVERAERVAEVLGISRSQLLIDALRNHLANLVSDDEFRRQLQDAFYNEQIDYRIIESVLETEEAKRLKLLRESLDHEPPEPQFDGSLPPDEEFYDDGVPSWGPDEGHGENRNR